MPGPNRIRPSEGEVLSVVNIFKARLHLVLKVFFRARHIFLQSLSRSVSANKITSSYSMDIDSIESLLTVDTFEENTKLVNGHPGASLTECRELGKASPMIIKNCVATAFFGTLLDLEEISWKKYGEFNPSSFAAAKFRLQSPATTALIFASGMVVCTGAPSEESALVAITKYYRMISEVAPNALCLNVVIQNIVGTAHLGHAVDLHKTFEWLQSQGHMNAIYDPELFPGLRFVPKDIVQTLQSVKVLLFSDGNIVMCGAKKKEDLRMAWRATREILFPFRCEREKPLDKTKSRKRPRRG
jgi:transcription initiation factor TFIID TATA-box-binding protein